MCTVTNKFIHTCINSDWKQSPGRDDKDENDNWLHNQHFHSEGVDGSCVRELMLWRQRLQRANSWNDFPDGRRGNSRLGLRVRFWKCGGQIDDSNESMNEVRAVISPLIDCPNIGWESLTGSKEG
jgi:hypothetical protein